MSDNTVQPSTWSAAAAEIDACRVQLRACEAAFTGEEHTERFDSECGYLGYLLARAHQHMLLLIERLGLPMFYSSYTAQFQRFDGKLDKVGHFDENPWDLYSDPLILLGQTFDALKNMSVQAQDSDALMRDLLERMLRQTPYILADREIIPESEAQVRKPLFDALKTVFPDCRREIPVSHIFKTYKADLGVPSLRALIEVKYALNEAELRSELDGIFADINGYSGDPQWNRFFAVFYTATPAAAPERLIEEFKLSRVDISWTPIIVHGSGTRRSRPSGAPQKRASAEKRGMGRGPVGES